MKNLDADYKVIRRRRRPHGPDRAFLPGRGHRLLLLQRNAGAEWLKRIADHFRHTVWLNPINVRRLWVHPTIKAVGQIFPMYEMTLDGLEEAVKALMVRR